VLSGRSRHGRRRLTRRDGGGGGGGGRRRRLLALANRNVFFIALLVLWGGKVVSSHSNATVGSNSRRGKRRTFANRNSTSVALHSPHGLGHILFSILPRGRRTEGRKDDINNGKIHGTMEDQFRSKQGGNGNEYQKRDFHVERKKIPSVRDCGSAWKMRR
jgi:hypothetical protein